LPMHPFPLDLLLRKLLMHPFPLDRARFATRFWTDSLVRYFQRISLETATAIRAVLFLLGLKLRNTCMDDVAS
jgi:hypothetical protein